MSDKSITTAAIGIIAVVILIAIAVAVYATLGS